MPRESFVLVLLPGRTILNPNGFQGNGWPGYSKLAPVARLGRQTTQGHFRLPLIRTDGQPPAEVAIPTLTGLSVVDLY